MVFSASKIGGTNKYIESIIISWDVNDFLVIFEVHLFSKPCLVYVVEEEAIRKLFPENVRDKFEEAPLTWRLTLSSTVATFSSHYPANTAWTHGTNIHCHSNNKQRKHYHTGGTSHPKQPSRRNKSVDRRISLEATRHLGITCCTGAVVTTTCL